MLALASHRIVGPAHSTNNLRKDIGALPAVTLFLVPAAPELNGEKYISTENIRNYSLCNSYFPDYTLRKKHHFYR